MQRQSNCRGKCQPVLATQGPQPPVSQTVWCTWKQTMLLITSHATDYTQGKLYRVSMVYQWYLNKGVFLKFIVSVINQLPPTQSSWLEVCGERERCCEGRSVSYDIMSVFTCLPATDYMVVCTLKRVKEAGTRLVGNEGGPILKWNHCVISYNVHIKGPVLET